MAKKKSATESRAKAKSKSNRGRKSEPQVQRVKLGELPRVLDPTLKLLWADLAEVSIRGDADLATLTFYAITGRDVVEQCRVQTTNTHLKRLADLICQNLNHTPQPIGSKD